MRNILRALCTAIPVPIYADEKCWMGKQRVIQLNCLFKYKIIYLQHEKCRPYFTFLRVPQHPCLRLTSIHSQTERVSRFKICAGKKIALYASLYVQVAYSILFAI